MIHIQTLSPDFRRYAEQLEREASPRALQLVIRKGLQEAGSVYKDTLTIVLRDHQSKLRRMKLKSRAQYTVLARPGYAPNVYLEVGSYGPPRARSDVPANQPPPGVRLRFLEGTVDRWTGGRNDSKSFKPGGKGAFRGRIASRGIIGKVDRMAGPLALAALEAEAVPLLEASLTYKRG